MKFFLNFNNQRKNRWEEIIFKYLDKYSWNRRVWISILKGPIESLSLQMKKEIPTPILKCQNTKDKEKIQKAWVWKLKQGTIREAGIKLVPISQQQHWKPGDEETMPSASSGGKCYFQTGFYIQPLSVTVRVEKRVFQCKQTQPNWPTMYPVLKNCWRMCSTKTRL